MRVNAHHLACRLHRCQVRLSQLLDLLREQRAVGIHNVHAVYRAVCQQCQRFVNVGAVGLGDRHNVAGRLVAQGMRIFDHVDRRRHRVDVGRYTHHVDHALLLRQQVAAQIRAADVCHDGQFEIRLVIADNAAQGRFLAEFPVTEILLLEYIRIGQIAHFHIIHTRTEIRQIQCLEIVDQTAVADGRIEDLDVRSECHQITLAFHRNTLLCRIRFCGCTVLPSLHAASCPPLPAFLIFFLIVRFHDFANTFII